MQQYLSTNDCDSIAAAIPHLGLVAQDGEVLDGFEMRNTRAERRHCDRRDIAASAEPALALAASSTPSQPLGQPTAAHPIPSIS